MKVKEKASNFASHYGSKLTNRLYNLLYHLSIRPVNYAIFASTSLLERSFQRAKTTGEKLLLAIVLCLSILWISIIAYASFYNLYLPNAEILRPVHLSFSVCPQGVGICSFPSANISFTENNPIKEVLGPGQVYSVIVDLEIPDTPVNRDLGMFMVVLRMYDRYHHFSAMSQRAALYRYKSLPMRIVSLMVWSPLYFIGFYDEKQTITMEMFSTFTDDFYHPSVGANIEIQSHVVQIYLCQLKFYAKFTGLKYLLHYWPVTSAVCGISFNIFLCVTLIAVAALNKRDMFAEIEQTLSSRNRIPAENGTHQPVSQSSKGKKREDKIKRHQGTQTKFKENDETFNLPVLQEPADFGDVFDEKDSELLAELRHRRVQ